MASESSEAPQTPSVPNPERRRFLGNVLRIGVGGLAGFLAGRATASEDETKIAEISSTKTIRLKEFPEITNFQPVEIDGQPIEGSVERGPQGFRFHAKNGQRIETVARELDKPSYIRSDLFDPEGKPIMPDLDTKVETSIFDEGDYYLVVSRADNANSEGSRFSLEVKDDYEHDIQPSFLLHPNEQNPDRVRFQPETLPILPDGDFAFIVDFNEDVYDAQNRFNKRVNIYAQEGDPRQLSGSKVSLPEDKHENELPYSITKIDSQTIKIMPQKEGPKANAGKWPEGSHISVVLPGYVMRVFTLKP